MPVWRRMSDGVTGPFPVFSSPKAQHNPSAVVLRLGGGGLGGLVRTRPVLEMSV